MNDVIIVGAGLFGSIIAEALAHDGHSVVVIDDNRPMAGSLPSACLMKPSWFNGMGKDKHEPSLQLLDDLFGLESFDFVVRPTGIKTSCFRVDPAKCIRRVHGTYIEETVTHVEAGRVETAQGNVHEAKTVIVAAGVWCNEILNSRYNIQPKAGIAFRGQAIVKENRISVWAPYKQLVGYQERPHNVWLGDGSAILQKNWTQKRIDQSIERCSKFIRELCDDPDLTLTPLQGIRPYVKGAKPCLFEELDDGLYLASGGAKNGTIAAGWVAHELRKDLS